MLGVVILITTVLRVWVIRHFPEPDNDAKGHLGIAAAVLADPLRVALHWVWPPGYHFFLAGLMKLGFTEPGIRLLDCAGAAVLPILVWRYGERTLDPAASEATRKVPFLAALLFAVMPIVNLLGTSSQQETLFTILIIGVAFGIDTGRFALAGALLAACVLIRYEACGGLGLLCGLRVLGFFPRLADRLPAPLARASRLPLSLVVPSIVALALWFLANRLQEGTWFGFIREIFRYTSLQRDSLHKDPVSDLIFFPVVQPFHLFGLTLPLFFLGIRRAYRTSFLVPLGIYLFLLGSYSAKAALGSGRYYEALTPFVCLAAAHGAILLGEKRRWAMPMAFGAAFAHATYQMVLLGRWTFHV